MQFESAEIKYLQTNNQSQPPGKMQHRGCCVPPQHTVKTTENTITFCVTFWYYILRQKLLHFALLLHFVSVITFCGVTHTEFLVQTHELHKEQFNVLLAFPFKQQQTTFFVFFIKRKYTNVFITTRK